MDGQPYPSDVTNWDWETIEEISSLFTTETRYLEFKRHLEYPGESTNKSRQEWYRDLEREFTAIANADGGILLFGIDDDGNPAPFEPPEHEVSQSVTQLIQNTTPHVSTTVSDPLSPPSDSTDRIAVAVRVFESTRKPVATSDSAYYVRINDQKQPMNRDQLESLFVEADRHQQAVRQLEMEIDRFEDNYQRYFEDPSIVNEPPEYHLIDGEALKATFRENTHLYSDPETSRIMQSIFKQLREIDFDERRYGRYVNGIVEHHYRDRQHMNREMRKRLSDHTDKLYSRIQDLKTAISLPSE